MTNNQNILTEKKISNSSMISTSLNGPYIRQRSSIRNNDLSSNITKKDWVYANQNKEKYDVKLKNELNTLNEIYYNKKNELNEVMKEYQLTNELYNKKYRDLENNKKKLEALRQKNLNLKLMIMNIIRINNNKNDK